MVQLSRIFGLRILFLVANLAICILGDTGTSHTNRRDSVKFREIMNFAKRQYSFATPSQYEPNPYQHPPPPSLPAVPPPPAPMFVSEASYGQFGGAFRQTHPSWPIQVFFPFIYEEALRSSIKNSNPDAISGSQRTGDSPWFHVDPYAAKPVNEMAQP
eukprot:jgi/Bigna1/133580/aug1.21_g8288